MKKGGVFNFHDMPDYKKVKIGVEESGSETAGGATDAASTAGEEATSSAVSASSKEATQTVTVADSSKPSEGEMGNLLSELTFSVNLDNKLWCTF